MKSWLKGFHGVLLMAAGILFLAEMPAHASVMLLGTGIVILAEAFGEE